MAFTVYTDTALLNHLLGSGTFTKPAALYVALFNGDPAAGGTEISSSGTAYARVPAVFTVATTTATNTSTLTWAVATASWGAITHLAVYDALTGGNQLVNSVLAVSKTVFSGDTLQIPSGQFSVTLT